ncbi:MAG: hypothetical protein CMJ78_17800 [Planctomycetaceae bacterium]|nr:hypothetical protein [Planctomycetaceae bacterium]
MPIARTFIDWNQPILPAVADFLIERYAIVGDLDLSNVIVVLPGRRAGQRLTEILAEKTENPAMRMQLPQIMTVGNLPEELYTLKQPLATELVQKLAWGHALRAVDREQVRQIIPETPADNDLLRWMEYGELLWQQHIELARDTLHFGDVAEHGTSLDGFRERDRWQIMREVQSEYLKLLDHLNLWDQQTARLYAIESNECTTSKDIVLVGMVDMNRVMREMIDQVAKRVTIVIHAPKRLEKRFDQHGCLIPEVWEKQTLDIDTQQVEVAEGAFEQAEATAAAIASYEGKYRADEITVGMADEALVAHLQRQLAQCDLPSRWVKGKLISETAPYRLLTAIANYVDSGRYEDFASLVRHPHVYDWLCQQGVQDGWLMQLDRYFNDHMQASLGEWLGKESKWNLIQPIYDAVEVLVAPLKTERRPLGEWSTHITDVMVAVYCNVELDRENSIERNTITATEKIHDALLEHTDVPEGLAPTTDAAQAIRLTLDQLSEDFVTPLQDEDAVQLLGWLELSLDDAPALIVTTVNEGRVPRSQSADEFLPNALRRHLGVLDNSRRYARDAYALSVLTHSREQLKLIVARHDVEGNALAPSRLLFAAKPAEVADRVLAFFDEPPPSNRPEFIGFEVSPRDRSAFSVPAPKIETPLTRINVTAFRTFITCPYRFYLRHVLRLRDEDDAPRELDAMKFGNLIHEVLSRFGQSEARFSTDADEIKAYLNRCLDQCAKEWFGAARLAPVNVQIAQVRQRLNAFAVLQAGWRQDGWTIAYTEVPTSSETVHFDSGDGRSIELVGRIDRIDRNDRENKWAVFDYKTGKATKPDVAHGYTRYRKQWKDLQLPLYRHLAEELIGTRDVDLGYITLPAQLAHTGIQRAEWSRDDLATADELAQSIVRRVLDGDFGHITDDPGNFFSEFESICQDRVFERVFEHGLERMA